MRRYYIVSGILLILSVIDFALAAPVLLQEKHQGSVDVVHIPKDLVTVLWERGKDEESMMAAEWFRNAIKAVLKKQADSESSVAHASSSAAPPGPDHGSTSVVQLPASNPASSIVNPNPLMESSRPSMKGDRDDMFNWPAYLPSLAEYGYYGPGRKLTGEHAPQPNLNQNKRPWTGPGPNFGGHNLVISEDNSPKRPALAKESGQAHEYEVVNVDSSGSDSPTSGSDSPTSTDSGFDGTSYDEKHQVIGHITASPKGFDRAHQYQIGHVQQTDPGPLANPDFDRHNWMNVEGSPPLSLAPTGPLSPRPSNAGPSNPGLSNSRRPTLTWLKLRPPTESDDEVFQGPSSTQELTSPDLHHQSFSTDSRQADSQTSIYAWKGKAKQSRRISDTARDVVNAAQRESRLQPTERSLASDPGRLVSSTVVLAHPHMVSEVIPEAK